MADQVDRTPEEIAATVAKLEAEARKADAEAAAAELVLTSTPGRVWR